MQGIGSSSSTPSSRSARQLLPDRATVPDAPPESGRLAQFCKAHTAKAWLAGTAAVLAALVLSGITVLSAGTTAPVLVPLQFVLYAVGGSLVLASLTGVLCLADPAPPQRQPEMHKIRAKSRCLSKRILQDLNQQWAKARKAIPGTVVKSEDSHRARDGR